eukprot:Blabericola_migrator_1__2677@NODE_175_length_12037_cov_81_938346_g152_i0_p9_GENE_NODE_175_length_12037_cov_81_938346_g152_i0NODE_175_length_12037_cov_81_938346_g152_i0_p9_ORF_typecomplete_len142_score4_26SVWC/PF15430_6/0_21_NODE_175_length_12037_cov_81_938346_g152_i014271852
MGSVELAAGEVKQRVAGCMGGPRRRARLLPGDPAPRTRGGPLDHLALRRSGRRPKSRERRHKRRRQRKRKPAPNPQQHRTKRGCRRSRLDTTACGRSSCKLPSQLLQYQRCIQRSVVLDCKLRRPSSTDQQLEHSISTTHS